jgi:hypothetical protein
VTMEQFRAVSSQNPLVLDILRALGVENYETVTSFSINFVAGEVATVDVSYMPSEKQIEELKKELVQRRYSLLEIVQPETVANMEDGTFHSSHGPQN